MTTTLETTNLVKHYFNICNTALASHKDSPIYGLLLALMNQLTSGKVIEVKVINGRSDDGEYFTTRFVDGEFTPVVEGKGESDTRFVVESDFLEKVFRNSDEYVDSPGKLDWSWVRRDQ